MTEVIYLIHPDDEDVFAYFPNEKWDLNGNMTCYAHIGQHGACCPTYAEEAKEATEEQYADLHKELTELVGYDDLEILNGKIYDIRN